MATMTGAAGASNQGLSARTCTCWAPCSRIPPTDGRRTQAQSQKAQGGLGDDHRRERQGRGGDDVTGDGGHQVAPDDGGPAGAHQFGGQDVVLLPEHQETAADLPAQAGPSDEGQDDGEDKKRIIYVSAENSG